MVNKKKQMLLANLSLLLVAILWGTAFIVTKNVLDDVTPIYMVAYRFFIATVIMGVFSAKKLSKIKLSDVKGSSIVGLMLFLGFATQTIGIQYTTAGKSAFLTSVNVVIVPFVIWIINRKKPETSVIVGAAMCFFGVGLLTAGVDITSVNMGDFWTILCALFFALHIITTGIYARKIDAQILTTFQFLFTTILALASAYYFEGPLRLPTGDCLTELLYLGGIGTCLCFFIQTVAQKYTTSTHAAILMSLESLFGTLFGIIFLKESFTFIMLIGCLIIFFAIITAETGWKFLKRNKLKNKLKHNIAS